MRLAKIGLLLLGIFLVSSCSLQSTTPEVDAGLTTPVNGWTPPVSVTVPPESLLKNPALADSPWPIFHLNLYAQASTSLRGPEPGDHITVQYLRTPLQRTSPWTLLSEVYPDGSRAVWGATSTHVFKARVAGASFEMLDSYPIDRTLLETHWDFVLLRDGSVLVPDRDQRRLLFFEDDQPDDPYSKIRLARSYSLPDTVPGKPSGLSVVFDGHIIFQTDQHYIVAVAPTLDNVTVRDLRDFGFSEDEFASHNVYSQDEQGGIYIVSTRAMTKLIWNGTEFALGWRVPYDFRGPGCENVREGGVAEVLRTLRGEPCTGSGTTPTLVGGEGDRLVVVVDGHQPKNHLVAFWRDDIPEDWAGLAGFDRRVAAVTELPFATPLEEGFSTENSPTAWGYDITVAQWGGLKPDCSPPPGVQKLRWNPEQRSLQVVWATDKVHLNGVMTYSAGSGLLYGSGRGPTGCNYTFYGLDWETGEVRLSVPLGSDGRFLDQGNQNTLSDDRSIMVGTEDGIVRLYPTKP
jgi:hypothetical protein